MPQPTVSDRDRQLALIKQAAQSRLATEQERLTLENVLTLVKGTHIQSIPSVRINLAKAILKRLEKPA